MEIRYINQSDDLLEISNIYENSWKYAYKGIIPQDYLDSIPTGRWVSGIDKFRMNNLVMIENGHIIGTASISKSRWQQYSDYGEIISIYFLPAYMGKGHGQHLLKKCIDELYMRGYNEILLWVLEDNQRARRFYEKNGFILSDEEMLSNIGGKDLKEIMYIHQMR